MLRRRGPSLIAYIGALAAALILPCFVLTGVITWLWVSAEQAQLEAQTDEMSDAVLAQLDRTLSGLTAMLEALATSPALDETELRRFDGQARQVLLLQGVDIVLHDLTGQQVVNTRLPFGSPLPKGSPEADAVVLSTKRPVTSDLIIGSVANRPIVAVNVPVVRNGDVVYLLKASLSPGFFQSILSDARIARPYAGLIADRSGHVVARSDGDEQSVGQRVTGFEAEGDRKGRWSGLSSSGVEVSSSYRRSSLSDWFVRVSLDRAVLDAPLRRSEYLLAGFAALLTALALVTSTLVVRRVLGAHSRLIAGARLIDARASKGDSLEIASTGVREVDDLGAILAQVSGRLVRQGKSLEGANLALERRVAERTAALEASRGFLRATLDNMDQGLLVIDAARRVPVISRRAVELVGLDPAMVDAVPTFDDVIAYQVSRGELSAPDSAMKAHFGFDGLSDDQTHTYERVRKDGTVIEVRTVPLPDGSLVRTYSDITARKRVEQVLLAKTTLLDATLESMDQGLIMIDADGVVQVCNERAMDLLDLPASLMRAKPKLDDVRLFQLEQNEFVRSEDRERRWLEGGRFGEGSLTYERERPNGTILEIRTVMLPDGSAVRTYTDITVRKTAERRIAASEARLRALTDGLPQLMWVARASDGETVFTNQRFRDYVGEIGTALTDRVGNRHPDDRSRLELAWRTAEGEGRTLDIEERRRRADGTFHWHKTIVTPVRHDGEIIEWLGTALDIDDMIKAREALQEGEVRLRASERRLAYALDAGSDGLWDRDFVTGEIWYSDRWQTMLGYEPGELASTGLKWTDLVHPDDKPRALRILEDHLSGKTPIYECEKRLLTKDGRYTWVLARGKVVGRDQIGRPLRIVGTHIDVSGRKEAEFQLAHMARHDPLTDLPNRLLFREVLDRALTEFVEGNTSAVLCLDLDRFKAVNDSLGHLVGDAVLRETAVRLRNASGQKDTVARLGGDEFAVLVPEAPDRSSLVAFATRLVDAVQAPMIIGEQQVEVGLSVGIALAPDHGDSGETIFRRADTALYRAKSEGRGRYRIFEPSMEEEVRERRELEHDLRAAMRADELELYYQPQMRCATKEILGFEALMRWRHPTRGFVPPSTFIPLAEETGLIMELGAWALRTACREASRWPQPLKIAVNLSPRQFDQADLPETVLTVLAETGLAPARLELEITETVIIQDVARALALLRRLKAMGITIAMDDFGTGYSSLATLQSFPFDKIKIDRSFVGQVGTSTQAKVIVRSVLGLGHNLGIEAIAEGVETQEQLDFLVAEGCAEVQGYLIGKPSPVAAVPMLDERHQAA